MIALVLIVLLLTVVVLAVALVATTRETALRSQTSVAQAHHEMRTLLSAVMASSATEFAQVERVLSQTRAPAPAERRVSPEEYERMLRGDLEQMGYNPDVATVPRNPEGL